MSFFFHTNSKKKTRLFKRLNLTKHKLTLYLFIYNVKCILYILTFIDNTDKTKYIILPIYVNQ